MLPPFIFKQTGNSISKSFERAILKTCIVYIFLYIIYIIHRYKEIYTDIDRHCFQWQKLCNDERISISCYVFHVENLVSLLILKHLVCLQEVYFAFLLESTIKLDIILLKMHVIYSTANLIHFQKTYHFFKLHNTMVLYSKITRKLKCATRDF